MKTLLRVLFGFLLKPLEAGDARYAFEPSHRKILFAVGLLFTLLAAGIVFLSVGRELMYWFPVLVFGLVGLAAIIVSALGSDRAVAKIWGNYERG